jgi:hypothetical protein
MAIEWTTLQNLSSTGLVWIQFPVLIRLSRLHKTGFVEGFDIRVVKQNLVQVLFKQTKKAGLTKPGTGFVLSFVHVSITNLQNWPPRNFCFEFCEVVSIGLRKWRLPYLMSLHYWTSFHVRQYTLNPYELWDMRWHLSVIRMTFLLNFTVHSKDDRLNMKGTTTFN